MTARLLLGLLLAGAPAPIERTVGLGSFDRVRVDGPFAVVVTAGPQPRARIVGEPRSVERVNIRVENRTLIVSASVSAFGGFAGEVPPPASIAITAGPGLRGIAVRGGGRLSADRLMGDRIDLAVAGSGTLEATDSRAGQVYATLTGAGRLEVGGRAARARFLSIGTGSIAATGLAVDDLSVSADSFGDSHFTARRTATISATGMGAVSVDGPATCTITAQRRGPVRCGGETNAVTPPEPNGRSLL